MLLDGREGRVEMFRNMAGNTFTYYCLNAGVFFFGSNLAEVARASGLPLRPDPEMLPVYFISRIVPGGRTLFEGICRLQPGERVSYRDGRTAARQVQTFADFDEPRKTGLPESIERLEATMAAVLGDIAAIAPDAACLLSGGVDSSYVQAHWNKLWRARNGQKGDGPHCAQDPSGRSGKWGLSPLCAAGNRGARPSGSITRKWPSSANTVFRPSAPWIPTTRPVRVPGIDARQMCETLSAVGEMPNHVQSFYFAPLGRAMADAGISAGLCGEGADGLFGNADAAGLQHADRLRRTFPALAAAAWGRRGENPWPTSRRGSVSPFPRLAREPTTSTIRSIRRPPLRTSRRSSPALAARPSPEDWRIAAACSSNTASTRIPCTCTPFKPSAFSPKP